MISAGRQPMKSSSTTNTMTKAVATFTRNASIDSETTLPWW